MGFISEFGYWSIAIVILVTYILLGTELIAEEIEDPFGRDVNDLPTDYLAEKIKSDVNVILHNKTPDSVLALERAVAEGNVAIDTPLGH